MRTKLVLFSLALSIILIAAVPPPQVPGKTMPKAVEPIAEFVAESLDLSLNRIRYRGMRETTFPNSCLCVQTEGVQCLDVMTDGYIIRFKTSKGRVTVHANASLTRYIIAKK